MANPLQNHWSCLFLFVLVFALAAPRTHADSKSEAQDIIAQAGISGGFFVHLGATDTELTVALRQNDGTQVQGLLKDPIEVGAARKRIQALGDYGNVAVSTFSGFDLPYIDNLVNLIVADDLGDVPMEEVLRVLVPNGVAMVKVDGQWTKTVKPRPKNIDDWTHYLHDATGNSVAQDDVVAPPQHLQWVGSPRWSRHHDRMASMSALVSSGGRMFYIMDEGSRISIQLPPKWKLIARDAFNGTVLWKKDIEEWQPHLWPLKSGPTQLSRRLVGNDNRVYVTLGYNAPLTELDAATGEILRTYEDSDATEEIINTNDLLFVVVRKSKAELEDYVPMNGRVGDQAAVKDVFWNEEPRVLMAFDAKTGEKLWAKKTVISPLTLAAKDSQIFFHDGDKLISLDQKTGDTIWQSESVTRRQAFTFNFGPRLVIYEDVVLYAGGDGNIKSLDVKSGQELWKASFPNSGYQSPQDLMVVGGLVWLAPLTGGQDSGVYTGRDPRTGKVKKEFAPNIDTYWFHHRCYIAKGTNNFLIPSRTGVEFVNPNKEHWDIHHWVRGGCLYGVMPCNGLTYTPPHNCACYPEAKLFGFNALAPSAVTRPIPTEVPEEGRLEKGVAYSEALADVQSDDQKLKDWPTYRHDSTRSGSLPSPIEPKLKPQWKVKLGGRLTPPVISGSTVYVSRIDAHTLHALDKSTGETQWTYTVGARIDSPPTIHRGRVVFGSTDGWVYCLNTDGQLVWRYRAAPMDRRTMAFEQLESLWPVHGSVLIHNDMVYCVAGRSIFLDGGLRLVRLDLATGKKLSETLMDEKNPETGNNIQEKVQILQMPVGLPDILSCDGRHIFMKSQKFDLEGNRLEIGPNSGDFVKQVSKQRGEDAHLFAPMGFLDETWFHRSYWVLGQSFAGGHGGYFQAGRFAPSGRIMVNGNGYAFGYGRKPEYLRWTTTLEHQLFAAEPNPPEIPATQNKGAAPALTGSYAQFPKTPSLNPAGKAITVEAWVTTTKPQGVIISRGGSSEGFALAIENGKPSLLVRGNNELSSVTADRRIVGGWHHIAGVLDTDKTMKLYVDGELAAEGKASNLIAKDPAQLMEIGLDEGSPVGEYTTPNAFTGIIDEVRLYFLAATGEQIAKRYADGSEISSDAVLVVSFDDGTARDHGLKRNDGTLSGGKLVEGKSGMAIQFSAGKSGRKQKNNQNKQDNQGNSLVDPKWTQDVSIYVRAMALAGSTLFIAGPPDIIDEEKTFQQLSEKDPEVQKLLADQDAALESDQGRLLSVNMHTGEVENEILMGTVPAWDAMAAASGSIFLSTLDGSVHCYGN
jgi:outer membrane protein assembly factor BamB